MRPGPWSHVGPPMAMLVARLSALRLLVHIDSGNTRDDVQQVSGISPGEWNTHLWASGVGSETLGQRRTPRDACSTHPAPVRDETATVR